MPILRKISKNYIAIDPGKHGGFGFCVDGKTFSHKMPETPKDVYDLLSSYKNATCVLEKVGGMPGNGGSAMFNFGKGYGHIEMALLSLSIRTITVSPQAWQKYLALGTHGKMSDTEWKNKLKAKAQALFPKEKVFLWNADALLILEYAMRSNL